MTVKHLSAIVAAVVFIASPALAVGDTAGQPVSQKAANAAKAAPKEEMSEVKDDADTMQEITEAEPAAGGEKNAEKKNKEELQNHDQ